MSVEHSVSVRTNYSCRHTVPLSNSVTVTVTGLTSQFLSTSEITDGLRLLVYYTYQKTAKQKNEHRRSLNQALKRCVLHPGSR